jgi:uncharacterized protein YndB with AHSA1/START domain
MPVRKDPSGERSVQVEVEVPGTPEEVWKAIATGQGMSAWFVPSTSDERAGGTATSNFGPGMESVALIKTWDPPRSFAAETEEGPGKVATEWTVEARSGGTCVVRVMHRWFASTDDWDNEFEGHSYGWMAFFRILRLYLTHFAGEKASAFQLSAFSPQALLDVWNGLLRPLRIDNATTRVEPASGAPALGGTVEARGVDAHPELLLKLDHPAPGLAHFFVMPIGGQVMLSVRFYLYGAAGEKAAPEIEREWGAWLASQFPPAA